MKGLVLFGGGVMIAAAALTAAAAGGPAARVSDQAAMSLADSYIGQLSVQRDPAELQKLLQRMTPLATEHPRLQPRVIAALIALAEARRSLEQMKTIVNALVEIGHLAPLESRNRIIRYFQASQRKTTDAATYDHLAWAVKQLKAEFIFGEML